MNGTSGRYAQLDALRAVAVLAVVASHTLPHVWARNGALGVQLFFVLSGFLITGILIDARANAERARARIRGTLRAFYARRFLRIFPIYYLVLAGAVVAGFVSVRNELPWHFFYVSNWWFAERGAWTSTTSHLWSLSVEEQFYLVWPLVVLLAPRRHLGKVIVGMIVLAPVVRVALFSAGLWPEGAVIVTPAAFDSLGLGALLAYVRRTRSTEWIDRRVRWLPVAAVALWAAWKLAQEINEAGTVDFALSGLWFPLLGVWIIARASAGIRGPVGALLEWRPLAFIGTISYGVYLLHLFVMAAIVKFNEKLDVELPTPERGVKQFVLVTVVAIAVATLSWFAIERPINGLKARFPYVDEPASLSSVGAGESGRRR